MKVNTKDLIGPILDWTVVDIKFQRLAEAGRHTNQWVLDDHTAGRVTSPWSTNWFFCGELIEEAQVSVVKTPDAWAAHCAHDGVCYVHSGPTPLVAVARCYVAANRGDEVEVPSLLWEEIYSIPSMAAG